MSTCETGGGSKLWIKVVRLCMENGQITVDFHDRRRGAERFARAVAEAVRLGFIERAGRHENLIVYRLTPKERWPASFEVEFSRPVTKALAPN